MKERFSALWTDKLKAAICAKCTERYNMTVRGADAELVRKVVNQGIDSHLESCYVPARGDVYTVISDTIICIVSPESMPVLIRRLLESGTDAGLLLASDILEGFNIELI